MRPDDRKLGSLSRIVACAMMSAFVAIAAPQAFADDDDDDGDDRRKVFQRIATFPVFLNNDPSDPVAAAAGDASAEIVAASKDGKLLIYTDGGDDRIGFVDISDPSNPAPDGLLAMPGEPTSVAIKNGYALVAVNTSADFVNTSGDLIVVDLDSRSIVETIPLGGQPDSIAVSPNGRYAAVAIENERNEDICVGGTEDGFDIVDESPAAGETTEDLCEDGGGVVGGLPQLPAGFLKIVDLVGAPSDWSTRDVDLTGLADLGPSDPEPEFVAINRRNQAAVTLQENNHIAIVRLSDGRVIRDFNGGDVDLEKVDIEENDLIQLIGSLQDVPREADAITAIGNSRFATADEGDLFGGSRGFTIYNKRGRVKFTSGNSIEHLAVKFGHYPEGRSENKGNEPEGITFAEYGKHDFLFVGSERANVILVYEMRGHRSKPRFKQVLPATVGPEGLLAIPKRDLFVVASEVDDIGDKIRSTITLYKLVKGEPTYPTIQSAYDGYGYRGGDDDDDDDGHRHGGHRHGSHGTPIPWAALSALSGDPHDEDIAYTAYDSFYKESRLFVVDVSDHPAIIEEEILLTDDGATVDLDVEGVAARKDGGFWVVSEGAGTVGDPNRPVTSLNLLLKVAEDGEILETIQLPDSVNDLQVRFGFEGVAVTGQGDDELVYVVIQREWAGDPDDQVRIGRYDPNAQEWAFFYYPLDLPESLTPAGSSWVGNSEIVALDDTTFAVLERDNQGGSSAAIKRIYKISIDGIEPQPQGRVFPLLEKELVRDLIPDLTADNGPVLEKVEGLGILANGDAIIVTDNDGVDDASGETQFIKLGDIFGLGDDEDEDDDDDDDDDEDDD